MNLQSVMKKRALKDHLFRKKKKTDLEDRLFRKNQYKGKFDELKFHGQLNLPPPLSVRPSQCPFPLLKLILLTSEIWGLTNIYRYTIGH